MFHHPLTLVETITSTSTMSTTTTTTSTTTVKVTPSSSTQSSIESTTYDLPLWTWWTPDTLEDVETWETASSKMNDDEEVINNDVLTKQINDVTSNRDNRESLSDDDDDDEREDESGADDDPKIDHEELRDKYIELMNHNTKLVDVLKKTLEMQADMFRRLIKYLFP